MVLMELQVPVVWLETLELEEMPDHQDQRVILDSLEALGAREM